MTEASTAALGALAESGSRRYYIVIAIGVAIGVLIFFLSYFQIEPFHGYVDTFVSGVSTGVSTIIGTVQSSVGGIVEYAVKNPVAAAISGLTATSAITSLWAKVRADRAKANTENLARAEISKAQQSAIQASQTAGMAQGKIDSLEKELKVYREDTFPNEARGIIETQKSELERARGQIEGLQNEIERLKVKTLEVTTVH